MQSQLIEEASKIIPNPQVLINVISRRVRQLSQGHRPLVETKPGTGYSDTALLEVIQKKVQFEAATAPGNGHPAKLEPVSSRKKKAD
jgi:DNA-directed RNA polymerase subunit omega